MGKKKKARAKKTSTKKRKEKRVKKKKRGMTKFSFVTQPRHFVLHIPNTPPHHHLCSRNKARRDRLRQFEKKFEKNPNPTREMPDQSFIKKRPNIRYKAKKNQSKRWCFLSNNKTKKRILSSPFKN